MSGETGVTGGGSESNRGKSRPESLAPTASQAGRTAVTGAAAGGAGGGVLPPGTRFGRYTIVRLLGQGGMGAVYEAQQESPRRSVALKVIRGSWLSAQLLKRFEHESQVLGRLQHPGIAQVYEAGSVQDERGETVPFFAMELIKGVPLTEYAAAKNLGTRERLELVARICDAVYHAHQKGVIHRDLKPGNILVDESGQPKVLDFGVARATDSDIQQTTMQTDIGQLIGTVPYMSPEQVGGDPNELDTRSDVYALGVIAYELLAGRLPYDLQKKMIHEAVRVIREEDPTRLSSLNRTLRGDIETIVAKALEKEKARRYQSAEALGSDIRRYLKDEPIAARPASTWYQAGKFARRNKVLVGGVAATFLVLVAGIIGVSLMLKRALEAESDLTLQIGETNAALKKTQQAEAETAKRADELEQVSGFQEKMLDQIDPTTAGVWLTEDVTKRLAAALEKDGIAEDERQAQVEAFRQQWTKVNATDAARELIDRSILRPAVKAIDVQFRDQPLVDARLRQVLADRYRELGLYEASLPLQERALKTRRDVLGDKHWDTLTSTDKMGVLLQHEGKFTEAEPYYHEALEKRRRELGEEHPDTLTSINNMGFMLRAQGKLAEAEPYYREALEKRRRVLGEEHPDTLTSVNNMGFLLQAQGKLAEAEPYYREALEKRRRVLGEEHPSTLTSIHNMGFLLRARGKLAEAEPYSREALEKYRRVLGGEHPSTLTSIHNMGFLLQAQGKLAEAEPYYREALEKCRRVLGEEHPNTLTFINNMGLLLRAQGKLAEAEPYYREALEKRRRVLGGEHPDTLTSINNMGFMLRAQGKLAEAEPYYREALEKRRRVLGEENPDTLTSINNLGFLLRVQGKLAEAEPYSREALEKRRRVLGEEHPDTLDSINNVGLLLQAQGKLAEAEPYYREALEKRRRVLGGEHPSTLSSINNMGFMLRGQGKLAEAEPYYREALEKRRRVLGEEHPDTLTSIHNMGFLLQAQGKLAEAEPYYREALEKRRRVLGEEHPDTLTSIHNMGFLLQAQGKLAEAEPYFREALERARHVLGQEHAETLTYMTNTGGLLSQTGNHQDAIDLLAPYEPEARKQFIGGKARRLADFLTTLGRARVGVGYDAERFKLAESNLFEAHQLYLAARDRGPTHTDTLACVQGLLDLYTAWDAAEPGKGYDTKAAEWQAKLPPPETPAEPKAEEPKADAPKPGSP